ncbi:MAG: hypothetical protein ABSH32_12470 [Bryobacteraceae bacterium]
MNVAKLRPKILAHVFGNSVNLHKSVIPSLRVAPVHQSIHPDGEQARLSEYDHLVTLPGRMEKIVSTALAPLRWRMEKIVSSAFGKGIGITSHVEFFLGAGETQHGALFDGGWSEVDHLGRTYVSPFAAPKRTSAQ